LSPINILEILQIESDLRRETVIRVLQELCSAELLAEPEALLVDFIVERTQIDAISTLRLESPYSVSSLSQVWKDIHSDSAKTFVFNDTTRYRARQLKLFNRLYHLWYRKGGSIAKGSIDMLGDYRSLPPKHVAPTMMAAIAKMQSMLVPEPHAWPFHDMILFLAACMLVVGVTPYPEAVDKLWVCLGIQSVGDRIQCVLEGPLKIVLSEGPLVGIAAILASQLTKKFNSGNLLDAYHISYLPYVSSFLTFDEGLLISAKQYPHSSQFSKIQNADGFLNDLVRKLSGI
jgi:hypothetical protein